MTNARIIFSTQNTVDNTGFSLLKSDSIINVVQQNQLSYFLLSPGGNLTETTRLLLATNAQCAILRKTWLQCHLLSIASVDHGDSFMLLSFMATSIPVMTPNTSKQYEFFLLFRLAYKSRWPRSLKAHCITNKAVCFVRRTVC